MAPTNRIKKYICWLWNEDVGRWRGVYSSNDRTAALRCRDEIHANRLCLALEFPSRPARTDGQRVERAE